MLRVRRDASAGSVFWLLLAGGLLVASAVTSFLSPCGFWTNSVRGVPFWHHQDPGGPYFASSVHFFGPERYPLFVGHPGLTLQLLIHGFLRGCHAVSGQPVAFERFVAKNIARLFSGVEIGMTALHLLSFVVLYRFAGKFLPAQPARVAVLGYATSFPALYYLSRISPEPLLVTFFLATVLAVWAFQEHAAASRRGKAAAALVAAGFAAAASFFTKIHLAALLVPYSLAQIVFERAPESPRAGLRRRLGPAALFLASSGVGFLAGSWKTNWRPFLRYWYEVMPGNDPLAAGYDPALGLAANYLRGSRRAAGYFLRRVPEFVKLYLTPSSWEGIFAASEVLFLAAAAAGLLMYWRRHPEYRGRITWLFSYWLLSLPILIHRASFHYYFVPLAMLSVFAGYFLGERLRSAGASVVAVLVLHALAIIFYVGSRSTDAVIYARSFSAYHRALGGIGYDERVARVSPEPAALPPLWQLHGIYPELIAPDVPLQRAFESFFTPALASPPDAATAARERIGAVLYLDAAGPRIVFFPASPAGAN
jgi:hypothetical protein